MTTEDKNMTITQKNKEEKIVALRRVNPNMGHDGRGPNYPTRERA